MALLAIEITPYTVLEAALGLLSAWYIYYTVRRWEVTRYAKELPGEEGWPILGSALDFLPVANAKGVMRREVLGPILCMFCTADIPIQADTLLTYFAKTMAILATHSGPYTEATKLQLYLNTISEYARAKKYAEAGIMKFWFGPTLAVSVWDPSYIEIVANSPHTASKGSAYSLFFGEMSNGVFTIPGGPEWKALRKPITKSMAKKNLDHEYFPIFVQKNRVFQEFLMQNKVGHYGDVKSDIDALSFDIFFDTHLGLEANEIKKRRWNYSQLTDEYVEVSVTACLKFAYFTWQNIATFTPLAAQIQDIRARTATMMRWIFGTPEEYKRLREGGEGYYTDFLLKRAEQKNVPKEYIYKELVDVLVAGSGTPAIALGSAVLFLAMFPEFQEEAYREQMEIFGDSGRDPTLADLANMKYLERVIKDTLRLNAPAAIFKFSEDHVSLGKYTIPKGSVVMILIFWLHRDPKYWERPHSFYPDHFLPEKEVDRPRYAYIPFGIGPRMCPGFQYTAYSLLVSLSFILRSFKLSTQMKFEDIDWDMKLIVDLKNGYPVRFDLR